VVGDEPAGKLHLAAGRVQRRDQCTGVHERHGQLAAAAAELQYLEASQRTRRVQKVTRVAVQRGELRRN